MSKDLKVGTSASRSFTIAPDQTIDFMGEDARVYATPELVRDIEHTCRDLIFERVPEGQDSVGTIVSIVHMAPTLLDMEVEVKVTVTEIDGRKVVFDVVANDPVDTICKGRHERFIVDVAKTQERLRAKAAKVANA
ncbi:MAG: LysR family transcriptional regulator [Rhodobacteraceae bacterium]|nr:LysR family transcriptional regulator [Paracoccaceae bacterium]